MTDIQFIGSKDRIESLLQLNSYRNYISFSVKLADLGVSPKYINDLLQRLIICFYRTISSSIYENLPRSL